MMILGVILSMSAVGCSAVLVARSAYVSIWVVCCLRASTGPATATRRIADSQTMTDARQESAKKSRWRLPPSPMKTRVQVANSERFRPSQTRAKRISHPGGSVAARLQSTTLFRRSMRTIYTNQGREMMMSKLRKLPILLLVVLLPGAAAFAADVQSRTTAGVI